MFSRENKLFGKMFCGLNIFDYICTRIVIEKKMEALLIALYNGSLFVGNLCIRRGVNFQMFLRKSDFYVIISYFSRRFDFYS